MNGTAAWDVTGAHDVTKCIDMDPFVLYDAPVVSDPWKNLPKKPKTKDLQLSQVISLKYDKILEVYKTLFCKVDFLMEAQYNKCWKKVLVIMKIKGKAYMAQPD